MHFAVIDTETNWNDDVMSLGVIVSDESFEPIVKCYYILTPEYKVGGMFSKTLNNIQSKGVNKYVDIRSNVIAHLKTVFAQYQVSQIFAYNARFDKSHLSEFKDFKWFDIMKVAAYKQYNGFIPEDLECHTVSGRIKHGYGVQSIYRMVTGNTDYKEKHNGYHDAEDELMIMKILGLPLSTYAVAAIN